VTVSEVPETPVSDDTTGVASLIGCPGGTPTSMASPTRGSLVHQRGSVKGQVASSMVNPTMEQLVAFGGIAEPSSNGVRTSVRIRAQPNADMPQMERAVHLAQRRDEQPITGTKHHIPSI
jgi:hypothetical protein